MNKTLYKIYDVFSGVNHECVLQIVASLPAYLFETVIALSVILDKGYRVTAPAWGVGNTFNLQPSFAKCEKKLTGIETIASDMFANERAIRRNHIGSKSFVGALPTVVQRLLTKIFI
jgi:hypothetical protein